MSSHPKYYLVEAEALPEIFLKVAEAKRMLSTGEARTVNEATRLTGISRSAYYKYRETVRPLQSLMTGQLITLQFRLLDEPGVLSSILTTFAQRKTNVMTVNSIVPSSGVALVTISVETTDMTISLEELLHELEHTAGVVKVEVVAG